MPGSQLPTQNPNTLNPQQIASLWIQAGGDPKQAGTMTAIAMAESGGNPNAHNPSGASGLWQILGKPFAGNAFDPLTNAKMAVAKYKTQGFGAWQTYTNGAYKQYLSQASSAAATAPQANPAPDLSIPNPLAPISDVAGAISSVWGALTNPSLWKRVLYFVGGAVLIFWGIKELTGAHIPEGAKTAAMAAAA